MRRGLRKILVIGGLSGLLLIGLTVSWRVYLVKYYEGQIYSDVDQIPSRRVAIVFGAAAPNFLPSDVLKERLLAGIKLYEEGRVEKILMSGDNSMSHYNEPEVMQRYAKERGVPAEDIQPDYAGRRTYDTCYRAKQVFGLDEVVLVSNEYHLPRAIYLCESAGVRAIGFNADRWEYSAKTERWWQIREALATSMAWFDVYFRKPTPILGERIDI